MINHQNDGDGLLMVRFKLKSDNVNDFEKWKSEAIAHVKEFQGFVDITVLNRLKDADYYHILLRFDSEEDVNAWMHSDIRKEIFNDSKAQWFDERQEVIHSWNMFWYRIFEGTKRWKQWAVTFIAVYPLTIVIPTMVKIIAKVIPLYFFAGIISAVMISGFMIFLILPFVNKLFKKWLHE
jgi:antibiotic biosynthesis monooxygenase (ABM) superfamily enzyme